MLQPSATRGTTFITQGARDPRAGHGCHTASGLQGSSSDQEQKQPSLQVSSTPIPPMAGGSSRAPEQLRVSWENSHAAPYRRGFSKGSPLPCGAKTQGCRRRFCPYPEVFQNPPTPSPSLSATLKSG